MSPIRSTKAIPAINLVHRRFSQGFSLRSRSQHTGNRDYVEGEQSGAPESISYTTLGRNFVVAPGVVGTSSGIYFGAWAMMSVRLPVLPLLSGVVRRDYYPEAGLVY